VACGFPVPPALPKPVWWVQLACVKFPPRLFWPTLPLPPPPPPPPPPTVAAAAAAADRCSGGGGGGAVCSCSCRLWRPSRRGQGVW
jgi:hypothetical protein